MALSGYAYRGSGADTLTPPGLQELLDLGGGLPDAPAPEGTRARKAWLAGVDLRGARVECGISRAAVARALDVSYSAVVGWERGRSAPRGERGIAYCRVVAGMLRHLEVTW